MTRFLAILALAGALLVPESADARRPPKPHHAPTVGSRTFASASSSSVTSLTAAGTCNWYRHTNALNASVLLNTTRFPNGAYLAVRYAFKATGTTTWRYTGWYGPSLVTNYVGDSWSPFGSVGAYSPAPLREVSFNITSGSFVAWAQVAVWNGTAYEYTQTFGDRYVSYDEWATGWDWPQCFVSR